MDVIFNLIVVTYNEHLKNILRHILDSYQILTEIEDKPGDLAKIEKEMLKINGFIKVVSNKIDIELAGALNNNTPMLQLTKAPYTLNNYINMQFLRISKNGKKFSGNLMIVNNRLEYYNNNSEDSIRTNYYQTLGVYFKLFLSNRLFTTNSFYYQTGKDQFNLNLNAYSISSKFSYVVKPKSVITSIGINVFSGNNKDTEVDENNSYSIPYGSFFNNAGLPGFYTLNGPKGKVAKHKGLIQPKAEICI